MKQHTYKNSHALLGDCMDFMRQQPDNRFDFAIVDPPYGLNAPDMRMGTHPTRQGDGYPAESIAQRLKSKRLNGGGGYLKDRSINCLPVEWDNAVPGPEYFAELFRISRHQIIWGGNYFTLPPTRGIICWDKLQPWDNFSQFELAWTSFDKPAKMIRLSNTGGDNREAKIHPTQKPVKLYEWLLKTYSQPGWRILDTHMGSQSSRIACYRAGLEYWGTEIDPVYYKDGNERFYREAQQLRITL